MLMGAARHSHTGPIAQKAISQQPIGMGAAELARAIREERMTSRDVVEAFLARIEQVNPDLNAVVFPLFDQARREADLADAAQRRGSMLGPLHGVPVTIKESFHVAGTPSTIGLTSRRRELLEEDGPLVQQLRRAGAIVLGKTNVPQLMIWHESTNPVYGRTNNPWNLERGPGGSTGGEAALIAKGGSPWGLGSDLGGSIRLPSHFCGIHGLKPTSRRLAKSGQAKNLLGLEAIQCQGGPLARRVEDLELMLRVLCDAPPGTLDAEATPGMPAPSSDVDVSTLRIAMWTDDGYFPVAPAIRRAVQEAADALRARGAKVESFQPPRVDEAIDLYLGLVSADRGQAIRRLLAGSQVDPNVRKLLHLAKIPNSLRGAVTGALRFAGQPWLARLIGAARYGSADYFWQLSYRRQVYEQSFMAALAKDGFDAMICAPHALPAMRHGDAVDLMSAAAPTFLMNLLGVPAGVVAATRVREGEESDRPPSRDWVVRKAVRTERGSTGLPVGVQVAARHWREDIALAVMQTLETAFSQRPDYPLAAS
jgi:fatty acid amide hydrolase